jgi:hypothetical protein
MKSILAEIETNFAPGTKIPKPESQADFVVAGCGVRRNERALIYAIPNHKTPTKPHRWIAVQLRAALKALPMRRQPHSVRRRKLSPVQPNFEAIDVIVSLSEPYSSHSKSPLSNFR